MKFDKEKLKKTCFTTGIIIAGLYLLFLVVPFFLSPIANSYCQKLEGVLNKATGLNTSIEGLDITTSPNLSAGIKIKKFEISVPNSKNATITSKDLKIRLAIIPLLIKKVQLDTISSDVLNLNLDVKNNGAFLFEDYLPDNTDNENNTAKAASLHFGLKLSNHLPNVSIKSYKISLTDCKTEKTYYTDGHDLKIKDFILDKEIKFSAKGKVIFDGNTVSNYDLKLANRIMPDLNLNDLLFTKSAEDEVSEEQPKLNDIVLNVIECFKSVVKNNLTADITANLKTSGPLKNPDFKGNILINALSVAVNGNSLPESYLKVVFKGAKTDIDSMFFTSDDVKEVTQVIGSSKHGKNPSIDFTLRSNAKINNIIRLIDSIAQSFGVNDFKTLSATGAVDADFDINSDTKKVISTGYLKVNNASIAYGLYNILIDKIKVDVDLMNNNINIKNASFSVLGQPLSLTGTIKANSDTNLTLTADKLPVKGLMGAIGQVAFLKDNDIRQGTISLKAFIKGKLSDITPNADMKISGVEVLNRPSATKFTLENANVKFAYAKKILSGDIDINSLIAKLPTAVVSIPKATVVTDSKNINIKNSYVMLNNSRIDVKGSVNNYLNDKMKMNISANGNIAASDISSLLPTNVRSLFPYAGKLPLKIKAVGNSKAQDLYVTLTADKSNYITLADIDLLKGKKTKLYADMKFSGDTLTLSDSGIFANENAIAKLGGKITKLYSEPKINISISVPNDVSFPIWGLNNSNITANANITVGGKLSSPTIKGKVSASDLSVKGMNFAVKDLVADLSGSVLNGNLTAKEFKFGGIVAENLSSKLSLKNYNYLYLSDISAKAFNGKVIGSFAYDILKTAINIDFTGSGLNSTDAIYGAVGIKNALTGTLNFIAKLNMHGLTDKEIINSMCGNVEFNISDGRFMGIGRLENLVAAQNIASNSVLKAAISSLSTLSTIQQSDKFKTITGTMVLTNGVANISTLQVAGPLMSYYVHGTYNILPNTANLVILGRLENKVVSCLGVLGEFSAEKILSSIPKFGTVTVNILKQLTSDPANENTSLIPELTSGSTAYRDFKVVFNGSVTSSSSVKIFKWLTTSEVTSVDVKKELQNAKEAVKNNVVNKVETAKTTATNVKTNINNIVETQKTKANTVKQNIEQTKNDLKNIKENTSQTTENLKKLLKNAIENGNTKVNTTSPSAQTDTKTDTASSSDSSSSSKE